MYGVVGWFPTAVRIRLSQPPAGLGLGLGLSLAISKNVMPGQNQYYECFDINFYIKVGKYILYYKLIKCEAF